jgi:hypothetical protein
MLDGYTVRALMVQDETREAWNYQGTLTRGSESTSSIVECDVASTRWSGAASTIAAVEGGGTALVSSNMRTIDPIGPRMIVVEGDHERWTATGVVVAAGSAIDLSATGSVFWDPAVPEPEVGPAGASWEPAGVTRPEEFQLPHEPIASLIGAIDDWVFPIGSGRVVVAERTGELLLGMNERWVDGAWDDNDGSWQVSVEVLDSG